MIYTLLTHHYSPELGGFEAIAMAQSPTSKRRVDCFFASDSTASDFSIIQGLLRDAKRKYQDLASQDLGQGFPISPNQVRYMTS